MVKKSPSLLFAFVLGCVFISGKTADLCSTPISTDWKALHKNETFSETQSECVKMFKYTTAAADIDKYLIFQISFPAGAPKDPLFLPYLLVKQGTAPGVTLESGNLNPSDKTTEGDTNGRDNRKSYHSIVISPGANNVAATTFVFGFFNAYTDPDNKYTGTFNYDVSFTITNDYICPGDGTQCSGHGTCNTDKKVCQCNKGYFDDDCSVFATEVTLSSLKEQSIEAYRWGYFYFNIGDFDDDLKISLQKESGSMDFSFRINEKDDWTIPNSATSNGKYGLDENEAAGYLLVQEDNISPRKNDVMLIGAYNGKAQSTKAQVLLEEYDDSSVIRTVSIYLMIGISLALLVAWVGISSFKYKHHTQMETLIRIYQVERAEEKALTKKDINKYFPKEKFKDLKTSFCQTMCSVCLEDFEPETVCRQLYCEHIYHGNCIEAWLNQHYNCPNCKKDITKVAIEEFLREKASKEEKSMLVPEKTAERKDPSDNSSHESGHIVGVNPQRVHIKKPREIVEESKENHDDHAYEAQNVQKNKARKATNIVHPEPRAHQETDLRQSPSHEDGRLRNLRRESKGPTSNNIPDLAAVASRNEVHSRAQNIRRNRGPHGTIIQQNLEAEANAFRLES